ncbi:hypothetical protein SNOG_15902 [Parastagonospora nodorum SN15]|uniref:Major facilitator superfamily (MFS) profile domain-containing protein n=1 Tax=Phaeosphaeria nodorum (strain SN15 / ATCC MYA-4574 / FGSC 10173) TaxID=321614 RepID=Q0TX85_PHANO|nr:hypothetical protein SNOG_15902 [Parastagonospora nodorum SN15]EAT76740.2 hypothetical protein SNOG_15902 [Parastagonospora nodorum SN15]
MAKVPGSDIIVSTAPHTNNDEGSAKDGHADTAESSSAIFGHEKQNAFWRRCVGVIWDSLEGEPEYRHYVQKLDRIFFGMKEDLNLYGNERNWLGTWFSLGVMVGSVPAQMSQLRFVRPSILIPSCEIIWSMLVLSMGFAKNIKTMYALRFFIGLFEACAFPGYIAMLGSWYGPKELTKRLAILLQVESIASMFSGYLQAGLYTSMNGRHGIAGWRWLFIMDAIISIPIAIWGFFGLPDQPHNTRAFYFSADHIKYGIERIEKFGRREQTKLSRKDLKRVYFGWEIWVFVVPYTVVKTNYLPTGGSALNIVFSFICGVIADATGQNYWMIVAIQLLMILCNIILSVWDVPKSALMFSYYVSYAGSAATPILVSWATQLTAGDASLRQLVGGYSKRGIICLGPVGTIYGYQILILFGGLAIISVTLMKYMYWRKEKKQDGEEEPQDPASGDKSIDSKGV